MTLEQIDRMVRQANPVPDLSALEPIDASVLDEQRRTEMQTHDRVIVDDEGGEPKRGRNLLIGIAAAAAIIIGALLLLRPLTEDPLVADQPTTTSAVETATAFVEAYRVNLDIDEAFSYLVSDAAGLSAIEEERLLARFLQAIGSKTNLGSCEELSASPTGTRVSCSFEYHQLRSDEMGLGPYGGGSYELTVLDQKITSFEEKFPPNFFTNPNGFSEQVWVPFSVWIATNYPEEGALMYDDWPTAHRWAITDESIALWEQRSREYVGAAPAMQAADEAEALAAIFVGAYAAFDIDQAASYLAPDANLAGIDGGDQSWRSANALLEAQGFKLLLDSCEQVEATTEGIVVRCLWDFHAIRSDEIGLGPFTGSWFDLTVLDGEIVAASMHWGIAEFSPQVWEPFAQWVTNTYPEDVDVMYLPAYANFRLTEESIALWEQRSREYVEVLRGTSG